MPVHFCQIAGNSGCHHQRNICNGGTVSKLLHPVGSREITGNQSGRKRNNQSRTNSQQGADSY